MANFEFKIVYKTGYKIVSYEADSYIIALLKVASIENKIAKKLFLEILNIHLEA